MYPRNADHKDLKLASEERRLRRDCVCINSLFGSTEDGTTCGIGSVQWRHPVIMRATTLVDQGSRNFTCSTWQLCTSVLKIGVSVLKTHVK